MTMMTEERLVRSKGPIPAAGEVGLIIRYLPRTEQVAVRFYDENLDDTYVQYMTPEEIEPLA